MKSSWHYQDGRCPHAENCRTPRAEYSVTNIFVQKNLELGLMYVGILVPRTHKPIAISNIEKTPNPSFRMLF
jgi:hypothetical protein